MSSLLRESWEEWLAFLGHERRNRGIVQRASAKMTLRALAKAFESWVQAALDSRGEEGREMRLQARIRRVSRR